MNKKQSPLLFAAAKKVNAADYTAESYQALQDAMTQAEETLSAFGGVTQAMADEACDVLITAMNNLEKVQSGQTPTEPTTPSTQPTTPPATEPVVPEGELVKVDLAGTVIGTCSSPYSSRVSYANQSWYSTQNPGWKDLNIFVDGSTSSKITYTVSSGERGDVYLDLTRKNSAGLAADQFKMYYGAGDRTADMPTVTVILELADGSTVEKTFTTNWSGTTAGTPIEWDFDETLTIKGIYAYSSTPAGQSKRFSVSEIELYRLDGTVPPPCTPC